MQSGVADIEQRFPVPGPAGLHGQFRIRTESGLNPGGVTGYERGPQICVADARVERQQPRRAIGPSFRCCIDEVFGRLGECEREFLHPLAQRIPRTETELAGNGRLCVMQGELRGTQSVFGCLCEGRQYAEPGECRGIAGARCGEEFLGLSLELPEIGSGGELRGRHGDLHAVTQAVRKPASTENNRADFDFNGRTQSFARTRGRPGAHGRNIGLEVKAVNGCWLRPTSHAPLQFLPNVQLVNSPTQIISTATSR